MVRRVGATVATVLLTLTAARGQGLLGKLEAEVQAIVDRAAPAVVRVETRQKRRLPMLPPGSERTLRPLVTERRVGTGFVVGAQRLVLASHAVVDGAESVHLCFADGLETTAEVIDASAFFRVAVLRPERLPDGLEPLELSRRTPRAGSFAILCGRAQDAGPSATLGLVGDTAHAAYGFDRFVVVSATLAPGESGSPVLGSDGKVLGLGSAALSDRRVVLRMGTPNVRIVRGSSATSTLACCISAADLRRVLDDVTRHGRIQRAWLGVTLKSDEPVVTGVAEKSPAAAASLRPGDRIETIGGDAVENRADLVARLARLRIETSTTIGVERGGEPHEVTVTLGARPGADECALLLQEGGVRVLGRAAAISDERLEPGDVVLAVDGEPVTDLATVRKALVRLTRKLRVDVVVLRQGSRIHLSNP